MEKICVLEICIGRFLASGSSVMVWNWYQRFDFEKYDVDFFTLDQPEESYLSEIAGNGGRCYFCKNNNPIIRKIAKTSLLYRVIQKNKYDCIHVHITDATFCALVCLFGGKRPIILHSHTSKNPSRMKLFLHTIGKRFLKKESITYFACSDLAAEFLFPRSIVSEKKYTVINNGIDVRKFAFNRETRKKYREKLGLSDCFVVGHVGRFAYEKNHEFLIRVFAALKELCPNARLLLVGDGEKNENLKDEIVSQVKTLKLEKEVIFYGNTDKVNEVYQAMDCFVLPSRYEGLGVVAIESQAAGLKTLCADTVPQEAMITDLLEYLPLGAPIEMWADKILSYNSGEERKNMTEQISAAGFDVATSAAFIQNQYKHLAKERIAKSKKTRGGVRNNLTILTLPSLLRQPQSICIIYYAMVA